MVKLFVKLFWVRIFLFYDEQVIWGLCWSPDTLGVDLLLGYGIPFMACMTLDQHTSEIIRT